MSKEDARPSASFAMLGGGALLVHALAVIWLLLIAVSSRGRVDHERFLTSSFATLALLGVGLVLLHLSRYKQSDLVYSYLGAAYTLLGILFFSAGAYDSAVQFSRGSLWSDRAAGLTFASLFLGFAVGGLIFMARGERPKHRWLVYLFATIYVALCLIVVCEYVFGGAAVQGDVLGDQFQVFIFGGLYLFGLYGAVGMGKREVA
jgi:hypothetical protein